IEWHFIGHLQKNKVRKVVEHCEMIHSVDSISLAQRVNNISADVEPETPQKILIQVNVAEDDAKFGLSVAEAEAHFKDLLELEHVEICGLMTIPNFDPDPEATRPAFARLRELRDRLVAQYGVSLPHLSMGMSHDFHVAVEEGATYVRVGSSIFGARDYAKPA
ncbi:MAG: YggS family pyridoxal phosphate-dependent enzyme, partial [Verrucomicrobiota bacterium]